jgi:hypothetical protein
MMLSPQDAASALHEIETAQTRSARLRGYARSSPHLVLWGVLWVVGYGLNDFFPDHGRAIWAAVVLIGVAAGFAALRQAGAGVGWRYGATAVTLIGFFWAVFAVMAPVSGRQIAAVIPLAIAAAYVLAGIWRGPRFIIAGAAVAALTLTGFFLLKTHFFLWMAGVGGASLILAGLWLKRV